MSKLYGPDMYLAKKERTTAPFSACAGILSATINKINDKKFKDIEAVCKICGETYVVGLRKISNICSKVCRTRAIRSGQYKVKKDM